MIWILSGNATDTGIKGTCTGTPTAKFLDQKSGPFLKETLTKLRVSELTARSLLIFHHGRVLI